MLLPLLFVNTTRMQDGNPGLVTNLAADPGQFNRRIDVPSLLADTATGGLLNGYQHGLRGDPRSPVPLS